MSDLTVQAPEGSHFEFDEVKTQGGQQSLGEWPILVWDDVDKARDHYGDEGLKSIWDGTSLRVSFQAIMRRHALGSKTADECATAQIAFRPGKRVVGASTPVSRASNTARRAAEKLGDKADLLQGLLARIEKGEISAEDLAALNA